MMYLGKASNIFFFSKYGLWPFLPRPLEYGPLIKIFLDVFSQIFFNAPKLSENIQEETPDHQESGKTQKAEDYV